MEKQTSQLKSANKRTRRQKIRIQIAGYLLTYKFVFEKFISKSATGISRPLVRLGNWVQLQKERYETRTRAAIKAILLSNLSEAHSRYLERLLDSTTTDRMRTDTFDEIWDLISDLSSKQSIRITQYKLFTIHNAFWDGARNSHDSKSQVKDYNELLWESLILEKAVTNKAILKILARGLLVFLKQGNPGAKQ